MVNSVFITYKTDYTNLIQFLFKNLPILFTPLPITCKNKIKKNKKSNFLEEGVLGVETLRWGFYFYFFWGGVLPSIILETHQCLTMNMNGW